MAIFAILGVLLVGGFAGWGSAPISTARAATQAKPTISPEASAALTQMGRSLQSKALSFQARTIRGFFDPSGELLHIFHTLNVTVRRPDRMLVDRNGDDGAGKLVYDGKTVVIYMANGNKYVSIPVPNTIEGMMKEAMGHLGVDFPLADFLTDAPAKAFLSGVAWDGWSTRSRMTASRASISFSPSRPGIYLELWVERTTSRCRAG